LTATFGLLVIASLGLTFQIITVFFPLRQSMAVYPSAAWVSTPWSTERVQLTNIAGSRSGHCYC
jgi:hypothetical protein